MVRRPVEPTRVRTVFLEFSVPQFSAVLRKLDFFNDHRSHALRIGGQGWKAFGTQLGGRVNLSVTFVSISTGWPFTFCGLNRH